MSVSNSSATNVSTRAAPRALFGGITAGRPAAPPPAAPALSLGRQSSVSKSASPVMYESSSNRDDFEEESRAVSPRKKEMQKKGGLFSYQSNGADKEKSAGAVKQMLQMSVKKPSTALEASAAYAPAAQPISPTPAAPTLSSSLHSLSTTPSPPSSGNVKDIFFYFYRLILHLTALRYSH